jgi:vesicle-fusing ATPase
MKKYKIGKLSNETQIYLNILTHNKDDFGNGDIYLTMCGAVYPSKCDPLVGLNMIGTNSFVRTKHELGLLDTIMVKEYRSLDRKNLVEMSMNIAVQGRNKDIISFHEDIIKEKIRKAFSNYLFSNNQVLVMKYDGFILKLDILCKEIGYIDDKTVIHIVSNDVSVNLVGAKLLKRDLFREDYNFEEIGIGGLDKNLLNIFRRALSTRAFLPAIIKKLGIEHVKGILLYGAPGCGKTLIARKIGSMITDKPPKVVKGPEIMDKYVGQSEKNIRELFKEAQDDYDTNGENASLHVIIFDEIDAICKKRGRAGGSSNVNDTVVNQLLSIIDGVEPIKNIFIIAMTNRKDLLDDALLRPGRIEVHIEIGLPDLRGRQQIFQIHTNIMKMNNMAERRLRVLLKMRDQKLYTNNWHQAKKISMNQILQLR